jgi:hypothetical protein
LSIEVLGKYRPIWFYLSEKIHRESHNWLRWLKNDMATIKQIDANRRNALKSTGPRTPEGKAAVRMNALRHGLRARTVVLPGEDPGEFHQLCDDLEVEWQPQSRTEHFYLEQMAVSQWKLNRMELGEADLCKESITARTYISLLDLLWKAQTRMERSYARAQRELERLQKSRRNQLQDSPEQEVPAPQPPADTPQASEPQPAPNAPSFISVTEEATPIAPGPQLEPNSPAESKNSPPQSKCYF